MSSDKNDPWKLSKTGLPPEEDFEALLEASLASETAEGSHVAQGEIVRGTIVEMSKDTAFVALGGKTEAHIQLIELAGENGEVTVRVGDEIEAYVVGTHDGVQLSMALAKGARAAEELEVAHEAGIPVEGQVTATNKGGVEVMVGGLRAFCPVSQLDAHFVPDPTVFIGQTLKFLITRLEGGRRPNIVLSRRQLVEEELAEKAVETRKKIVEGARLKGHVRNVREFGAFVDLGGVEGLVHVSEMSWERVDNPEELVQIGDEVEVEVLSIDWDKDRISLSMRAARPDPWSDVEQRFQLGGNYAGRVVRLADYGAFVSLAPAIDGLIHVSELDWKRVNKPQEVVQVGDQITVRVLEIDAERRRISLSLKQASGEDPWTTAARKYPIGAVVDVTVEKVERFGVFVTLEPGLTGLIPASESNTESAGDLRRHFPVGGKVSASVLNVSPAERRLSMSVAAVYENRERAEVEAYQKGEQRRAKDRSSGGGSFGTFGDLLRGKLDDRDRK